MDIGKFINNSDYYDDSYFICTEVIMQIKENPEFNLHIDECYFMDIFGDPIFNGRPWVGFTRDYQEGVNGWDKKSEIGNIDEYISDMMRYADRTFEWKETPEVFQLIIDFLNYAKMTGQTVVVEVE